MDLAKSIDLKEALLAKYQNVSLQTGFSKKVQERKELAFKNFEKSGFPTTKHEEYKYFNLKPVISKEYKIEAESGLKEADIQSFYFKDLKANRLIFINGKFSSELSELVSPESELEIKPFSETDSEVLEKYFGKESYTSNDPLAELNTAYASDGIYIRIPKNKTVSHPVVLHFVSDATQGNVLSQPRNLFLSEDNSQVTFVETFNSVGADYSFTNAVTEIVLKDNSIVNYYKLQDDLNTSYHVGATVVTQEGKSTFNGTTITMNGAMVRNNLNVVLKTPHSEANFYGLYFSKDKQVFDNHTMVDHAVPNCVSNELYKGILEDKSVGVFNGKIFVKQDAQKTNAFQSNKNVLLSKDATMNTKPQLEIFADDVKCSHGATVGQLETEPLFYLRSRGIGEESARAMLLIAFAKDIIDNIRIEPLQRYLSQAIEQRLIKN